MSEHLNRERLATPDDGRIQAAMMPQRAPDFPSDVGELLAGGFGDGDRIVAPWPRAGRSKSAPLYDRELVAAFVAEQPRLVDVDTSELWCTQPWVLRSHVRYYLGGEWERTGRTSADMHVRANRYPLLHVDDRGRTIILAGHHRSLAATLLGRPVRARMVGTSPATGVAVTPTLVFAPSTELPGTQVATSVAELRSMLATVGLSDDEVGERLRFAGLDDA